MSTNNNNIHFVECPRDAMQGWKHLIATEVKIKYLQALLQVGFNTLDFGSFVSAKAIPQMADTKEVVEALDLSATQTKLLAIVANTRGAAEACQYNAIRYLGFPFSVSPTFQQRNTNSTIEASLERVKEIQDLCVKHNKQLVVYLSMAFGNPYGDAYNAAIVFEWANKMAALGITIISLADTVGLATPEQVQHVTATVIKALPNQQIGVHLHSTAQQFNKKLEAALAAGCRRFDGAMKGIGGCPMANDDLVGNMNTEWMLDYFTQNKFATTINTTALTNAAAMAAQIFI
ncbi:MAG: hydroxymethylglutaryl-CoA lyase [Flavihumibacter sp.]|nr:hydroxymethylglutaryl-CoA lyase [Flavihumibacter sp.]